MASNPKSYRPEGESSDSEADEYFYSRSAGKDTASLTSDQPIDDVTHSEADTSKLPDGTNAVPLPVVNFVDSSPDKSTDSQPKVQMNLNVGNHPGRRFSKAPTVSDEDLRVAIMHNKLDEIKLLVEKGFDLERYLKGGWTCLMYSCNYGHLDIVTYLLGRGANPNANKNNFTPLMAACLSTHNNDDKTLSCVEVLINHGCEVNRFDSQQMTALMYAAKDGKIKTVQRLISAGANLNLQDKNGYTALCWASCFGHVEVVRALIGADADCKIRTTKNDTAQDLAFHLGFEQVVKVIEELTGEKVTTISTNNYVAIPKKPNASQVVKKDQELEDFLRDLNLPDLYAIFENNGVVFMDLLRIEDSSLSALGIHNPLARKTLLQGVAAIHKQDWEASSLPQVKGLPVITCPDAKNVLANINHHLEYLATSIEFIDSQIKQDPKILQYGKEIEDLNFLTAECEVAFENLKLLYKQVEKFHRHIKQYQGLPQYHSCDLISLTSSRRHGFTYRQMVFGLFGVTILAGVATTAYKYAWK